MNNRYRRWTRRLASLCFLFTTEEVAHKYYLVHIRDIHGWCRRFLRGFNRKLAESFGIEIKTSGIQPDRGQ